MIDPRPLKTIALSEESPNSTHKTLIAAPLTVAIHCWWGIKILAVWKTRPLWERWNPASYLLNLRTAPLCSSHQYFRRLHLEWVLRTIRAPLYRGNTDEDFVRDFYFIVPRLAPARWSESLCSMKLSYVLVLELTDNVFRTHFISSKVKIDSVQTIFILTSVCLLIL